MSIHKDIELKEAILNLPEREKDKLLIRLINKDKMLIKQLHYRLLEDEHDLSLRIERLKEKIKSLADKEYLVVENTIIISNIKNLLTLLRLQNALVNEHEKVTKDMFSVVECKLYILETTFYRYPVLFRKTLSNNTEKLHKYISTQLRITFTKFDKLHEDLQFDLQEVYDKVFTFGKEHGLC